MNVNIPTSAKMLEQQQATSDIASIKQADQEYIQLQAQREKIFFSPMANNCADKQITTELKKNNLTENKNFYDQLDVATDLELTEIFINLVNQIKLIDAFYCTSKHLNDFNMLISRIERESINLDIASRIRNICYWLHGVIKLLQNLQYQHEHSPETISISKEAIAVRLEECLVNLDLCWDGISSRFAYAYEILNSLQQGLAGKIFLAKKYLFQTLSSQFINRLKQDKNYYFHVSMEIHISNLLHNLVADKLGFISIKDKFSPENFPIAFAEEFKELVTIEVSPANITRILAEQLYEDLSNCLTKINLQNWLHTPKKDTELNTNLNTFEASVFAPANTLYNNTTEQKLGILTIIDETEIDNDLAYSLNRSQEKLHFWVASSLMSNTEKLLIANIYNLQAQSYFSIATIDYMFFWGVNHDECKEEPQKINFNADNYISLNLSHIQQLDFIDFNSVNINEHLDLYQHDKKISISISLVSQALHQTNSAIMIMFFFTDNHVNSILENSPLINKKLKTILKNKLSNNTFKQYFIDEISNYYANPLITKLTKHETFFLIQYKLFSDIFPQIIKLNLDIPEYVYLEEKLATLPQQFKYLPIRQYLINEIKNYYANHSIKKLTKNETCFLMKHDLFSAIIPEFINNNLDIFECFDLEKEGGKLTMFGKQFENLPLEIFKNILSDKKDTTNSLAKRLIALATYMESDNLIYLTLKYSNYNLDTLEQGSSFSIAVSNNNPELIKLLLKSYNIKIDANVLYDAICYSNDITYQTIINNISYNKNKLLNLLPAISYDNTPAIFRALIVKNYNRVINYLKFIFSIKQLSQEEKLSIFTEINKNKSWLDYIDNPCLIEISIDSYIKNYIDIILSIPNISSTQALNILKAENIDGNSVLYLAIKNGNIHAVAAYINNIMTNKIFNIEEKFTTILAQGSEGSGLYLAIKNNNPDMLSVYIKHIIKYKLFSDEQLFEILQAKDIKGNCGLYVALQDTSTDIATKYIEHISNNCFFTAKQNFELILAKGYNTNTISTIIENGNLFILTDIIKFIFDKMNFLSYNLVYDDYTIDQQSQIYDNCAYILDEYISIILNNNMLNINKKEEICYVVSSYYKYKNLINQSNLCPEDKQQLLHSSEILNVYTPCR